MTKKKKSRLGVFLLCLVIGAFFGIAIAGGGAWFFAKSYAESSRLWKDLSKTVGFKIEAKKTKVIFFPPQILISKIKGTREEEDLFKIDSVDLSVEVPSLFTLALNLKVKIDNVLINSFEFAKNKKKRETESKFSLPTIPLRRVGLELFVTGIQLPTSYVPTTNLVLVGALTPGIKTFDFDLERFQTLGLSSFGQAKIKTDGTTEFSIELPKKRNFLYGKLTGQYSMDKKYEAKGSFNLSRSTLNIPDDLQWNHVNDKFSASGALNLGGDVKFHATEKDWTGEGSWNLNLTPAKLEYDVYEKPKGQVLTTQGTFSGTKKDWVLSDVLVRFGYANGRFNVSKEERGTRIVGDIPPFELSEFTPLIRKVTQMRSKLSGKMNGKMDLILPEGGEPTGTIKFSLEKGVLEPSFLVAAAKIKNLKTRGQVYLKSKVSATLENGKFKKGLAKVVLNATPLSVRYGDYFKKKSGQRLLFTFAGKGAGRSMVVRGLRMQGPPGLRVAIQGKLFDFQSAIARFKIVDGQLPLTTVAKFVPKMHGAGGIATVRGKLQGSLKNLDELFTKVIFRFMNVSFKHPKVRIYKMNGELEGFVSGSGKDSENQRRLFVRFPKLKGRIAWKPDRKWMTPARFNTHGKINWLFNRKLIMGGMTVNLARLNAIPFLTPRKEVKTPLKGKKPPLNIQQAQADLNEKMNFRRSSFRIHLNSSYIKTPYENLKNARVKLVIGAGSAKLGKWKSSGLPDVHLEKVSANGLGGSLSLGMKYWLDGKLNYWARASKISMKRLAELMRKFSGKDLKGSFYGKTNLNMKGEMNVAASDPLGSVDATGVLNVRNGGFSFLPTPEKVLLSLEKIPSLGRRLEPATKKEVTSNLEKATAKFHLTGDKLDLDVVAVDQHLAMNSTGFVTLNGFCDMKGKIFPKAALAGKDVANALKEGADYTARGSNWDCGFSPKYEKIAGKVIKAQAKKLIEPKVKAAKQKTVKKAKEKVKQEAKRVFKDFLKR